MNQPIIQDMINTILDGMHRPHLTETCDTVKTGDPTRRVTSLVTTFMATHAVIEKAAALGANFIITHEPTFYTHHDSVDWLSDDGVYEAKRRLIDDNGIIIWRLHDHIHIRQPDGIVLGLVQALGWEACMQNGEPHYCVLPPMRLAELCAQIKERLGIRHIRLVGDLNAEVSKVVLPVGAAGGGLHYQLMKAYQPDVIVCGELNEWEVSEYIRDANQQGQRKAILAIGHANSEEPGMAWLAQWLGGLYPDLSINHIPAEDPFVVV